MPARAYLASLLRVILFTEVSAMLQNEGFLEYFGNYHLKYPGCIFLIPNAYRIVVWTLLYYRLKLRKEFFF